MKVIIIKSTYHKKGMISQLVEEFIRGIKKGNNKADIEIFDLLEKEINFCKGCYNCQKNPKLKIGKCVINDEMIKLLPRIIESDIVVFATPVYDYGPTALMKRFIERCYPLVCGGGFPVPRNKKIRNKKGIMILSTGCPSFINEITSMNNYSRFIFKKMFKWIGCAKNYFFIAGGMERNEKTKKKFLKKSYELGIKVAKNG